MNISKIVTYEKQIPLVNVYIINILNHMNDINLLCILVLTFINLFFNENVQN